LSWTIICQQESTDDNDTLIDRRFQT